MKKVASCKIDEKVTMGTVKNDFKFSQKFLRLLEYFYCEKVRKIVKLNTERNDNRLNIETEPPKI